MRTRIQEIFDDSLPGLHGKIAATGAMLVAFNLLAWGWALAVFRDHPLLLGTALVAYSFGLRHAVDADHIAAIDNVTRKLMREGRRPIAVGLFFSLGHSTVVVALSVAIAATTTALQDRFADFKAVGGMIGTGVSAFFLLAIAALNMGLLASTWRALRQHRRGVAVPAESDPLAGGGLLSRLFRRLFRLVGRSWHMYPLGLLFGLGFDTATEVGVLGISATGASSGLSPWTILVFPALFSAGMALVDTADGILMLGAYGWAYADSGRRLAYNFGVTLVSVVCALAIGGFETLGLAADRLGLQGAWWDAATSGLGFAGYGIVSLFAVAWLGSMAVGRVRRLVG